jgi:hypothetical protein
MDPSDPNKSTPKIIQKPNFFSRFPDESQLVILSVTLELNNPKALKLRYSNHKGLRFESAASLIQIESNQTPRNLSFSISKQKNKNLPLDLLAQKPPQQQQQAVPQTKINNIARSQLEPIFRNGFPV